VVWFGLGLLLGIIFTVLMMRARAGSLKVSWYQWPMGLASVPLLMLALQNYLACQEESEPRLALFSLLTFGLPAVLLLLLLLAIPLLRRRKGRKSAAKA
jgi:hypothetical protein